MTDKHILKYTNHFSHTLNPRKRKEETVTIVGDCKITNYDTRKEDGSKKGYISITFNNEEESIYEGRGGKISSNQSEADFSSKNFSIFSKIANLDGNSELSINDIRKMDKSLIESWGLADLRFDYKNGVATLVWKNNDILRIDFSTQTKTNPATSMPAPIETKENNSVDGTSSATGKDIKTKDNPEIAETISEFSGGNIDINDVEDLASVAKYTGISENYIKNVLVNLEGKKKWPLCEAEYDNVPKAGNPKGFLTIGFGHTSLAGAPIVTEGLNISVKQAYQILANDIMTAKNLTKKLLKNRGLDFETMPKSIQNSIIDIVFNKGGNLNNSLVANLKESNYGAAARRTWHETQNVGLHKRNMYRFMYAISDLDKSKKCSAIEKFRSEHINQLKKVFKKDIDAKKDWNKMCENLSLTGACI